MPAQLANESFRADHVRFVNSVGAVVQVPMRSDVPAAEAFFRDHFPFDHASISDATKWTATYQATPMGVEPPDQHNSFGGVSGRGMITRMILVLAVFITAHFAFAQEEHAATGCAFPAFGWPT